MGFVFSTSDIGTRAISLRYHGPVFLGLMFGDFLDKIHAFLKSHPSEAIMFRLRKEYSDANDNSRTHQATLRDYLSQYDTYKRTTTNIILSAARGKFIILNDFEFYDSGIPYNSAAIQDMYNLKTNNDLYRKWERVRDHLNTAKNGDFYTFYINYFSGSGNLYPYYVASGHEYPGTSAANKVGPEDTVPGYMADFPRGSCGSRGGRCIIYEGTNILGRDRIQYQVNEQRTVGIIMADFPGATLISETIQNNCKTRKRLCK